MQSMSAQLKVLGKWTGYKRYQDNRVVAARLVSKRKEKWVEVKDSPEGNFFCPHCGEALITPGERTLPNFFMRPVDFHEKHKPVT